MCKGEFEKTWSDEEALQEMKENFGNVSEEEREIVCDNCFNKLLLWVKNLKPESDKVLRAYGYDPDEIRRLSK